MCALALCLSLYLPTSLYATSASEIAVQGTVEAGIEKTSEDVKTPKTPKPPKTRSTDLKPKTGETSTTLVISATALGVSICTLLIVAAKGRKEEEAQQVSPIR
jgi:hypothetical protein